jgi:hypothetical protein
MYHIQFCFLVVLSLLFTNVRAEAATLRLSPETGVYTAGGTFTANVVINTEGKSVNAADGQLSYNPKEISVVSVNRNSSIFNLWTLEPTFSNTTGSITFGGGSPSGYKGANGNIMSITFRALGAGAPKVIFKGGSILAADGLGTNILTSMVGGTYTIGAKTDTPEPEYIAPPNTPKAPVITSKTHPNFDSWYTETSAELSWTLPSDVTTVRTLLDEAPLTIPTIVYEDPVSEKRLENLPDGVSYFHIQFKNKDGWGKVTHVPLRIDTESPTRFEIGEEGGDPTNPVRTLVFTIDDISPIPRYRIQIDGGEPLEYSDEKNTKRYELSDLPPGHHTVIIEAFDSAGNSRVATYAFSIESFEAPLFTDYPTRINTEVIPALKGTTRPEAHVRVAVTDTNGISESYETVSGADGVFTFIPDAPFALGVYDIVAIATDIHGAVSEPSVSIRIIVETPGILRIGTFLVSVLSVIIPLIALSVILAFGTWYLVHRLRIWKRRVMRETIEAEDKLRSELDTLITNVHVRVSDLKESRKGKLTRAEEALIEQIVSDVESARIKIKKEIKDIEDIVE